MTPSFLVDTDVMIDFLRGTPEGVDFVKRNSARIILSSIVVAELYAGVKGDRELAILDDLVSIFSIIPVSPEIARLGGLYKRDFGKSHGVGLADAILAATAEIEGAELRTLNIKHYPMLKALKPAYRKV